MRALCRHPPGPYQESYYQVLVEATYESYLQVTDYSGYPNLEGIRNAIDEVAQRVPAAKNKRPEEFVNTRFLKELEKDGFFKELHP